MNNSLQYIYGCLYQPFFNGFKSIIDLNTRYKTPKIEDRLNVKDIGSNLPLILIKINDIRPIKINTKKTVVKIFNLSSLIISTSLYLIYAILIQNYVLVKDMIK